MVNSMISYSDISLTVFDIIWSKKRDIQPELIFKIGRIFYIHFCNTLHMDPVTPLHRGSVIILSQGRPGWRQVLQYKCTQTRLLFKSTAAGV